VCPKSYITAKSLGFIESFTVWSRLGWGGLEELSARDAEAFLLLLEESKEDHD
jgi:hypothetical protein